MHPASDRAAPAGCLLLLLTLAVGGAAAQETVYASPPTGVSAWRILGPGEMVYEPWVLDPAKPSSPAFVGDNNTDNVEVITIDSPDAGSTRCTSRTRAA